MFGCVDFVMNGQGHGPVGSQLQGVRFEPDLLRPYVGPDGRHYVALNTGKFKADKDGKRVPERKAFLLRDLREKMDIPTANATLTKDAWIELDRVVMEERNKRTRAWSDLLAANPVGGFNAMARATFEYQATANFGIANIDMDGMTAGQEDRPLTNLRSIPLPITHSDFSYSSRDIMISRNGGLPLDTASVRQGTRVVVETIEQLTIGTLAGITYGTNASEHTGTSTIYGYTNFPSRTEKTDLTTPIGSNPEAIVQDVLEMIDLLQQDNFNGPYMLYHSTPYSLYLNSDYFRSGSTSAVRTVRERLMEIDGLTDIRRLDFLTSGFQLILIQMDRNVAEAINGMEPTLVQWESQGGARVHMKVMAIQVPLIKADYNGLTGIVHGTTS